MARRTKEDADATRNSLLDAAERVFYEKGVSRASLSDIAQAAGATRGAIYWHFKDKVALFNAMMDRVTHPLEQVGSKSWPRCSLPSRRRLPRQPSWPWSTLPSWGSCCTRTQCSSTVVGTPVRRRFTSTRWWAGW